MDVNFYMLYVANFSLTCYIDAMYGLIIAVTNIVIKL